MARIGFYKQMDLRSRTSQYRTLSRGPRVMPDDMKNVMRRILEEIRTGVFAREWEMERTLGYPVSGRSRGEPSGIR